MDWEEFFFLDVDCVSSTDFPRSGMVAPAILDCGCQVRVVQFMFGWGGPCGHV